MNTTTLNQQNKTGLKRDTSDKFYTSDSVVLLCYNLIKEYLKLNKKDLIIEPSAGDGAFINIIKNLSNNYKFYDITPNDKQIIKQDYLLLDIGQFVDKFKKIHIIGNPPFGRQSSLAIKFIKKSCNFCNTISFILPKSFKKDSMKKYFPNNFHNLLETDLPDNSFLVDGKEHNVPCIFQIWEKKEHNRIMPAKLEPINYKFVKKEDNPDISFRRVGVYAGNIDTNIEDKSFQSHYFIKLGSISVDDFIEKYKTITFECNNTVGPKSISKQELIHKLNKLF